MDDLIPQSFGMWLVAFGAMSLLEVTFALYMRAAGRNMPGRAAFWAGLIHLLGAVAILSYVDDHRYLSATLLGAVVGTFGVVAWSRHQDSQPKKKKKERSLAGKRGQKTLVDLRDALDAMPDAHEGRWRPRLGRRNGR